MFSCNDLKRHLRNVTLFKAYSFPQLLREAFVFPMDYYFGNGKSSYPMNIVLLTTMRCNLRCEMCNVAGMMEKGSSKEISLAEIEKLLHEVAKYGPSFTISGGEPFLRNDVVETVRLIKKNNCSIGIFTNGTLLNEKIMKGLVAANLDYIAFSLESGNEKMHNAIVKSDKAFQLVSKNIEFFCKNKRKTTVLINTTITEKNVSELEKIVLLGKTLGVDFVRFNHLCFLTKEECNRNREFCKKCFPGQNIEVTSLGLENSNLGDAVEKKVMELKKEFGNFVGFAPELSGEEITDWYSNEFYSSRKCLFPWRGCFISPALDVYPCEPFSISMGNLRKSSFMEIWNNEKYTRFRRELKKGLFPGCARCCKL